MAAGLPTGILLAGAALSLWSGWRCLSPRPLPQIAPYVFLWALGLALVFGAIGLDFGTQGMPDHAATAYAAGLALLFGHVCGLALLGLSEGRPAASTLGRAMTFGLPPFGAFAGLWLGFQSVQASLLLLPSWPSLLHALGVLTGLTGGVWAWKGSLGQTETNQATVRQPVKAWARGLLMGLAAVGAFLPWVWVLPAQVAAAVATGELPMLLIALGMMLSPVMPGQASVIPFGLMAIAMALTSVLLLVLRLTRRTK